MFWFSHSDKGEAGVQSYGEQYLEVGEFRCGTVRVLGIHMESALYPRLGLRLGIILRDIPPSEGLTALRGAGLSKYEVWMHEGELRVGEGGPLIGLLWPTNRDNELRSSPYHSELQLTFACDLDLSLLESIEKHRAGRALRLSVILWPSAMREGERLRASMQPLTFEIPRDNWIEFLSKVGFGDYDVIEVRRPLLDREGFEEIRGQLNLARTRIWSGEYNSAVAAVRTALERFISGTRDGGPPLKQLLSAATDDVRGEAYAAIITKTMDVCHRAVHKPEATIQITRAEAIFILRSAESGIALVAELLGPTR